VTSAPVKLKLEMESSLKPDSQSVDAMPASQALAYVVDDEEVIATTLALILSRSGFEAMAFTEPLEALRAAELRCPDFLITDVAMPGLNGIDLAIQFKAIYPRCRILLFSGALSTAARIDRAREKGAEFSILAKPVHPNELLATLKKLRE
jgi:DNA-binding response OmpR family regulator